MWLNIRKIFSPDKSHAEWYLAYIKNFRSPKLQSSLQDVRFVVFDTETTGLNLKKDEILSIGAVRIFQQEINIQEIFNCRIRQSKLTTAGIEVTIHGLIQTGEKGIDPIAAIPNFYQYLDSSVLVGHHTNFDCGMLHKSASLLGGGPLKNFVLDTAALARRLDDPHGLHQSNGKNYSLDALCHRFNIETKDRHTALGDAFLTALVFLKLLSALEKRGIKKLSQLHPKPIYSPFKFKIF